MTEITVPPGSLQAHILGDIEERHAEEIQRFPIARFKGRLVARYRTLAPRAILRIMIEAEKNPDEVDGVIEGAADLLVASCDGVETEREGEVHELPKLGKPLADFLAQVDDSFSGAENDRQAVFLIFGDDVEDLVRTANQLRLSQTTSSVRITEELVGNSDAAS